MKWSRISPIGDVKCTTANCGRSARWHFEAGGVGSDYCSECRDAIYAQNIEVAARAVVAFDWSDNDADAVEAIDRLRRAVNS